jgi:hypothetical protein
MNEIHECPNCKWRGHEDELIAHEYDYYNMSMVIETCCPNCMYNFS